MTTKKPDKQEKTTDAQIEAIYEHPLTRRLVAEMTLKMGKAKNVGKEA